VVSSKLSALQHDFVEAFFQEPSSFFLTGGAALAGYYIGHRFTDDLDLFSPPVESMDLAVQRLRRAADALGATVESVQEAPEFRRFVVRRGEEATVVDLVIDRAPQLLTEKETIGHVRLDSQRKIAANKCRHRSRWRPVSPASPAAHEPGSSRRGGHGGARATIALRAGVRVRS
jgi:hypothetical protein